MQRNVVDAGVSEAKEDCRLRRAVPAQITRDDDVVTVAEESAKHPAKRHLDQRHIFLGSHGRSRLRLSLLEVVLVQDQVVDVEPPRETGSRRYVLVLEDDVAEHVHGDQLLDPVLNGTDEIWADVDQSNFVGLPKRESE